MKLTILSYNKQIFEGAVTSLTIPGSEGRFQMLANHAPIISTLQNGKVVYTDEVQKNELIIEQGILSAYDNQVILLVEIEKK